MASIEQLEELKDGARRTPDFDNKNNEMSEAAVNWSSGKNNTIFRQLLFLIIVLYL